MGTSGGGSSVSGQQRALEPGEETCNELAVQLGYFRGRPPNNVPFANGPFKSMVSDGNLDDMDKVKLVIKKPNKMGQKFFSISRGKRATPYRVFVTGHMDIKHINEEVDMSYPEAVAKLDADARRFWVQKLTKHARQFFRVVFSELWTWEFGEQHHLDMLNILDEER